jgi:hypothetical protein
MRVKAAGLPAKCLKPKPATTKSKRARASARGVALLRVPDVNVDNFS